jgi:hypothetical protein
LFRPELMRLEDRTTPSALADSAYTLLNQRVAETQANFFVYKNVDHGGNHGFPSGFFAGDANNQRPDLINQIRLNTAVVNDPAAADGASTDPNALDRVRGTVLQIKLPAVTGTEFVGVNIEEPEHYGELQTGVGYDLRGATRVIFEARSPSPGGIHVQFGVGERNTDRNQPFHLTSAFQTFQINLATLRDPDTNAVSPPNLAAVHVLFTTVISGAYESDGGIVLLDNIRFDPVPTNPTGGPRLSLPVGNQVFGVVPAVIHVADDGDPNFAVTGPWVHETAQSAAYQADHHVLTGGQTGTAAWTFAGLEPRIYEVQTTWAASSNNATSAPYVLFDDDLQRGTVLVDQTAAPAGTLFDGRRWHSLGLVRAESDTLKVELSAAGVAGGQRVLADAVRIVPVIPPDQAIPNLATVYEASLVVMALLDRGTLQDLANARLIADTFVYALHHDVTNSGQLPTAPDGARGLRDAYSSGDIALRNDQGPSPSDAQAGQIRLAGFSTDPRLAGPSGFALVLDGAFGGNNAFAIMALAAAHRKFGDAVYLDTAREIGRWIVGNLRDPNGPAFNPDPSSQSFGGFFLGYPDQGVVKDRDASLIRGKSIENNGDIFAAFTMLAEAAVLYGDRTEHAFWTTNANIAGDFVVAMYDPGDPNNPRDGHFHTGTLFDPPGPEGPPVGPGLEPQGPPHGTDVINAALVLDSNTFTTLPLAVSPRYRNAIDWREPVRFVVDTFGQQISATTAGQTVNYTGYNIVQDPTTSQFRPGGPIDGLPTGIAWEFTAQVPVTMGVVDRLYGTTEFANQAAAILAQLRQAQLSAPFGDGLGLVASTVDGENDQGGYPPLDQVLGTPFQGIAERVGLAATTWAILADRNLNIFASSGVVQFSAPKFAVNEAGGIATITATRLLGTSGPITVNFSTSDGSAKKGVDYRRSAGTLSWADGDAAPKTFTVTIRNDVATESDEIVRLTLSNPTGGALLGMASQAKLRILDDDPVRRRVTFTLSDSAGSEAMSSAEIKVVLTQTSAQPVRVRYAVAGGSAKDGADYTLLGTGTLTFAPGQKRKFIRIAITNDAVAEFDETVVVKLFAPTGALLGLRTLHTYRVVDND